MNKMLIYTKVEEICCNNKKNDDIKQIKYKIFDKVIDLIHDKQSCMLGPEKTKILRNYLKFYLNLLNNFNINII
jgi:hypothetical protein